MSAWFFTRSSNLVVSRSFDNTGCGSRISFAQADFAQFPLGNLHEASCGRLRQTFSDRAHIYVDTTRSIEGFSSLRVKPSKSHGPVMHLPVSVIAGVLACSRKGR